MRRSFPNAPQCGFTPLHAEQGWCTLPCLPFPCRPNTPLFRDGVEESMSAPSARYSRTSEYYPAYSYVSLQTIGCRLRGVSPKCVLQLAVCLLPPVAFGDAAQGATGRSPCVRVRRVLRPGSLPCLRRCPALYSVALARNINMCGCAAPNHTANTTTYTALLPRCPPRDCLYESCLTSELT